MKYKTIISSFFLIFAIAFLGSALLTFVSIIYILKRGVP
jgi:hypothetical protein